MCPSRIVLLVSALSIGLAPTTATSAVIGFLDNFDVINDTGSTAHGFEIDLEGLYITDISDVFGGVGRGFPSGRGFDPNTAVVRYGAPTFTEYVNGAVFGTKITYKGLFDGTSWDYGTPSGTVYTPGDNCWTGCGIGYGPDTPCDHFGVGTTKNATKVTYEWLLETATPGVLSNGTVNLPTPVWTVDPPAAPNAPPAQVVAKIEAPAPADGVEFGDAIWVKVFTTELENEVDLEELVGGNPKIDQAVTEVEWQLLQKEVGNPLSGLLENGGGAAVGGDIEAILRRYEFYKFSGEYDSETHEALFGVGYGDTNPGPNDIGTYIGAQNVAANIAPVPEIETYLMMMAGLGTIGFKLRRRTLTSKAL